MNTMLSKNLPTMALAVAMGLAIGGAQAYAETPVQAGKNTDVGGSFICDCTNTENSCSCKVVE
jgi:hypothetical protein